jgi:hypothetical protein
MEEFVITKDLLQAVVNYLVKQPYGDVFQLVAKLTQLSPLVRKTEEVVVDVPNVEA